MIHDIEVVMLFWGLFLLVPMLSDLDDNDMKCYEICDIMLVS